jgi:hypothetical protein
MSIIEPESITPEPVQIICILDRSGSMSSLVSDVIGSYNTFIEKQKSEPGEAEVTLVLFDTQYEEVYSKVNVKEVPLLDNKTYFARGGTALLDAVGRAISSCNAEDAIVLIQTDGEENSSREFTKEKLKELISKKEKAGWDFIFLGANIDAFSTGASFGLSPSKSVQYTANSAGIDQAFMAMSTGTANYRASKLGKFNIS